MSSSTVSMSTSSSPSVRHPFESRVEAARPSKTDINHVIMDYLINEGFPSAAKHFSKEANISHPADEESIEARVEIRNAIYAGQIEAAIHKINDLDPQILDRDSSLHFSLLRLQLIELIRECMSSPNADINPALDFAQQQLAPRAPTDPSFLHDLELTMTLLIFPSENLAPELAALLQPSLRKEVAVKVNEAIIGAQGEEREARIRNLIRLRAWAEKTAREQKRELPERLPLGLDNESLDDEDEPMNGGGAVDADAMVS